MTHWNVFPSFLLSTHAKIFFVFAILFSSLLVVFSSSGSQAVCMLTAQPTFLAYPTFKVFTVALKAFLKWRMPWSKYLPFACLARLGSLIKRKKKMTLRHQIHIDIDMASWKSFPVDLSSITSYEWWNRSKICAGHAQRSKEKLCFCQHWLDDSTHVIPNHITIDIQTWHLM